ncbi:MAG: hypothetical protein ACR2J0_08815 [Mycobacteriales bacterium]
MNDLDLAERARADLAGIELRVPTEQVLRRGTQLRRVRRMPLAGAVAIAAAGGLTLWSAGPGTAPAYAGYTSSPQSTDPATAGRIVSDCRSQVGSLPLRLLDRRGSFSLAVFTDGVVAATCERYAGREQTWREGGGAGPGPVEHRREVSVRRPLVVERGGRLFNAHHNAGQETGSLWGWCDPRVTAVQVHIGGSVVAAALLDGTWSAWWPHDGDPASATVVALDREGNELARVRPFS